MKKTIYKLRQKPQKEKEKIAFFGSLIVTFIIVLFYLAGVTTLKNSMFENPDQSQVANVQKPLESFKNQLMEIINSYK